MKISRAATPIAVVNCVAACRPVRSRASRSAWAISWPITAAGSPSVAFSLSIKPVKAATFSPGMHQALTSSDLITLPSHFHAVAASRYATVCGTSRCTMRRTRSVCAETRLSWRQRRHLRTVLVGQAGSYFDRGSDPHLPELG